MEWAGHSGKTTWGEPLPLAEARVDGGSGPRDPLHTVPFLASPGLGLLSKPAAPASAEGPKAARLVWGAQSRTTQGLVSDLYGKAVMR